MASANLTTDNKIELHTQFREKALVDQVPGAKWDRHSESWKFPCTYTVLVQLLAVFGRALELSEDLHEIHESGMTRVAELEYLRGSEDVILPDYFRNDDLTPLQRVGVEYLLTTDGCCLLDEQGSGKTVQVCAAIDCVVDRSELPRVLVVCPGVVVPTWKAHVDEWTHYTPFVMRGTQKERATAFEGFVNCPGPAVLITTWELTWRHSKLKSSGNMRLSDKEKVPKELNQVHFDLIIADEAHRMANPRSKQTMAMFALEGDMRIALTGTPICNHPGDFWSLLHFVDPVEWPARSRYIDRYCATTWSPFGGVDITGIKPQMMAEFHHLTDRYMIRRLQHEVIGKKISIVREERSVELSPRQRKLYKAFKKDLMVELPDGSILAADNPLEVLTRAMQLSCATLRMEGDKVRLCLPSPVVDELLEIVRELEGEPVVVFSASKQLLELAAHKLEAEGVSFTLVTGDTPPILRQLAIDDFQEGKRQVFLATMGTASEGVTLTAARTLVYLQRSWSMVKNLQAQDRIRRWGQESDTVTVIDIITRDTVTERLFSAYAVKRGRLDEITLDSVKEVL